MNYRYIFEKGRSLRQLTRVLFLLLIGAFLFVVPYYFLNASAWGSTATEIAPVVILDAGHGGEDGGAVAKNGVKEKDLNFAVTMLLAEQLRLAGVEVILTRTEDKLLYREEENIKGHKKEYDLKNRLEVARAHPEAIFVSIHMNTFREAKYSGLQVYYAPTEGSSALAESIQRNVCERVQPQNKRKPSKASSSIYLLENAVGCAVLVECGFLSNPGECELLSQKDYQTRLSSAIFCGIIEYIEHTAEVYREST